MFLKKCLYAESLRWYESYNGVKVWMILAKKKRALAGFSWLSHLFTLFTRHDEYYSSSSFHDESRFNWKSKGKRTGTGGKRLVVDTGSSITDAPLPLTLYVTVLKFWKLSGRKKDVPWKSEGARLGIFQVNETSAWGGEAIHPRVISKSQACMLGSKGAGWNAQCVLESPQTVTDCQLECHQLEIVPWRRDRQR